jgi:hypothetical protein
MADPSGSLLLKSSQRFIAASAAIPGRAAVFGKIGKSSRRRPVATKNFDINNWLGFQIICFAFPALESVGQ